MISLVPCTVATARAVLAGDRSVVNAARGWPHADTLDALRPWAEHGSDASSGPFLVVLEGEVVGDCGWYGPPGDDGEVEIGYGLAAPFRGRGHGTEAVRLLLDWVRAQPGVTSVVAETEVTNAASRRVLERLGFSVNTSTGPNVAYHLVF